MKELEYLYTLGKPSTFEHEIEAYYSYKNIPILENEEHHILKNHIFNNLLSRSFAVNLDGIHLLIEEKSFDSEWFKRPTYMIHRVYLDVEYPLQNILNTLRVYLMSLPKGSQCIMEVPSENIQLQQLLSQTGFIPLEYRLKWYHTKEGLKNISIPKEVRISTQNDVQTIGELAAESINPFDRFHADPSLSKEEAICFLGEFGRASANGFCDVTFVHGAPPIGFISSRLQISEHIGASIPKVGQLVIGAVKPSYKGIYKGLMQASIEYLYSRDCKAIWFNTQSTNTRVIWCLQNTGSIYAGASQIWSFNNLF